MKQLMTVDVPNVYNVWNQVYNFFKDSDRSELDETTIESYKLGVLNRTHNLLVVVENNIIIGVFIMYFINSPTCRILNIAFADRKSTRLNSSH